MTKIHIPGLSTRLSYGESMKVDWLFIEPCENQSWESRGWYDGAELSGTLPLAADGAVTGSTNSIQFAFAQSATAGTNCSTFRKKFTATDNVYLSFWIKLSSDWVGSGSFYHPHIFYLLTNQSTDYSNLAYTELTLYVETNTTSPRLAIQDGRKIDADNIGVDLIGVSETRSVAGCNSGDVYDNQIGGDCYLSGDEYWNGKFWDTTPNEMNLDTWHRIEAFFKLNTISGGVGQADGIARLWLDGILHIDDPAVIFRTNETYVVLSYDQGSGTAIVAGDTVTGGTSGATGKVLSITLASGTWGVDAAGELILYDETGTFQDNEDLNVSTTRAQSASAPTAVDNSTMQFDQLIMAPFIGDGSPSAQTLWIDQIQIGIERTTDFTAPVLSNPTGVKTSSTTGSGTVDSVNDANGVLWFVVSENGTSPSAAQILAGDDQGDVAGVDSGNQAVTATGTQPSIGFTGLTASTAYYAHYLHVDAAGNNSNVVSSASFTTDASDSTAPVLTLATGTKTNSTTGTGTVTTDEGNGLLYAWATTNSSETAANIKTNSDANGDTKTVTASGLQTGFTFTSLTPNTSYYTHYVQEDVALNQSNVESSSGTFTTDESGDFDGFFTDGAWSTTFDYSEACTQRGLLGGTDCETVGAGRIAQGGDGVIWTWGAGTQGGNATEALAAANNSNGDGGLGMRAWVGDGVNSQSGEVAIDMLTQQKELWIRWYQRYETGFQWINTEPQYDKTLYIRSATYPSFANSISVIPEAVGSQWALIAQGTSDYYQVATSSIKWSDVFGTTSDGLWHMFEIYLKMDTDQTDGVGKLWIDGTRYINTTGVDWSNGNASSQQGWGWFDFHNNQREPNNGGTEYVDYDDIAIYRVTPPNTDSFGDPWIGPLNGFSGGS